jgi:hypothetical protein
MRSTTHIDNHPRVLSTFREYSLRADKVCVCSLPTFEGKTIASSIDILDLDFLNVILAREKDTCSISVVYLLFNLQIQDVWLSSKARGRDH